MSRMHVAHADALFVHVFGKVLGHALGQHRDQRTITGLRHLAHFADEVINLGAGRTDFDRRVDQAGRADDLLDEHAAAFVEFPAAGRGRDRDGLRSHGIPLFKAQRPIVHAGRQAEAVFGQGRFTPEVAAEHAAELRHGDVRLVGEHQRVVGHVFEQSRRRFAGQAAGEITRIVFDAGAGAGRFHHFEVVAGALFEALGFEQAAGGVELLQADVQFRFDRVHRLDQSRARRDVMRVGVDLDEFQFVGLLAGERIEFVDRFDVVAEQRHPPGAVFIMRREDFDDVAAHPERAAKEIGLRALVLQARRGRPSTGAGRWWRPVSA